MKGYSLDPHPKANVTKQSYAVIYSPEKNGIVFHQAR